jgi:hypothetical protein
MSKSVAYRFEKQKANFSRLLWKLLMQQGKIASTGQSVGIAMTLWRYVRYPP